MGSLTVLYGNAQEEATKFKPKPGSFELAKKPLQTLSLTFFRDRLYRIEGVWQSLDSEDGSAAILNAFRAKFGEPSKVRQLKPTTTQLEPGWPNPMYRRQFPWADKSTAVSLIFEAVDYTDRKAASKSKVIGIDAQFEMIDLVTKAYVDKTNGAAIDNANRDYVRRNLGM